MRTAAPLPDDLLARGANALLDTMGCLPRGPLSRSLCESALNIEARWKRSFYPAPANNIAGRFAARLRKSARRLSKRIEKRLEVQGHVGVIARPERA